MLWPGMRQGKRKEAFASAWYDFALVLIPQKGCSMSFPSVVYWWAWVPQGRAAAFPGAHSSSPSSVTKVSFHSWPLSSGHSTCTSSCLHQRASEQAGHSPQRRESAGQTSAGEFSQMASQQSRAHQTASTSPKNKQNKKEKRD